MSRDVSTTVDERASSITGVVMAGVAVAALGTLALLEEAGKAGRSRAPTHFAAWPAEKPPKPAPPARQQAFVPEVRAPVRAPVAAPAERIDRPPAPIRLRRPPDRPKLVSPDRREPARSRTKPNASPPPPRRRPDKVAASPAHPLGSDFAQIVNVSHRKKAFIAALLPIVRSENERVLQERRQAEKRPTAAMYRRYRVKPGDQRALIRRIDALPASLAIAQAAIESGWGTSRFLREANNVYGERTYKKSANGLAPHEATGFKITVFRSIAASVRSYIHNLNSNAAYREFRDARAARRRAGGMELVEHLTSYSELRGTYIATVRRVIEDNKLHEHDYARLATR